MKIKLVSEAEVPDEVAKVIFEEQVQAKADNIGLYFSRYINMDENWSYDLEMPYRIERA